MSSPRAPNFPRALFSAAVEVFAVPCPLDAAQLASFAQAGFRLSPHLTSAVISRRDQFTAGRYCAWRASQALHYNAILPESSGERAPNWPPGLVGSIAHAQGLAVAVSARSSDRKALGVDAEPCMSLERAATVRSRLLTPGDETVVAGLTGWSEGDKVTLVFSAKEAIYKCLFPICLEYFGFHDAALCEVDPATGVFGFKLLRELPGGFASGWTGRGRFAREDGWIFTALELPS